ncbi:putative disintegrin and metalloproteinase domain-containing protein 5 [Cebus imitator]|uniref:putative disintegrin and metalloproteinase domain-containing protein 5 n=1 Tax=Cebus imitator TaxID=2715852 RepID=UPI00189A6811|nr:putative disintegrin and metalloproteinase domain-containing protein 5 [Cebus imitator]
MLSVRICPILSLSDEYLSFLTCAQPSASRASPGLNVLTAVHRQGSKTASHVPSSAASYWTWWDERRPQSLLSSASLIHFYDKNDIQHSKPLLVQMNCDYNGYVAGIPNSLVTLSTCSGLRGTIQLRNISYGIEPMEAVSGFIHKIYEEKYDNTNILSEENDTYSWFSSEYQVRKSPEKTDFIKLFPRYLEMYIVVDKNLFKPVNTICRKSVDKECDFTEFCNGNLSQCMPDTYARNGEYCDSGAAYCFNGKCRSFDKQCEELLGKGATGAPIFCFDEINTRGDNFGNCGREHCIFQHILCGKLVCSWEHRDLITRPNLSVIYAHVRDEICVSTVLPRKKPVPENPPSSATMYYQVEDRDETFVQDGSMCGPEMYCLNMSCKHARFLMDLNLCNFSVDCNRHGVCNNFGHCHCENGYNPPHCKPKKGAFGSIDDGHLVIQALTLFTEKKYGQC